MRNWPEPPKQAPGSMDCEFFAASFIALALGFTATWEDVRNWKEVTRMTPSRYPEKAHGAVPSFCVWGGAEDTNEECLSKWNLSHANANPDFRSWVKGYTESGNIGYASYHAGSRDYNHAVALLEADDEGVLLADSVHGLLRLPWKPFCDPYGTMRECAMVWAWYSVKME